MNHEFGNRTGGLDVKRLALGKINTVHPDSSLAMDRPLDHSDIPENTRTYPIDFRSPIWPTSDYVTKFLTNCPNDYYVKEDLQMKTNLSELLEKMEEHRNSRGMVGLGKDDKELGTPNFEPETAIAPGTEEITDEADKVDDKADAATRDAEVFGDTPVKHAEAGAAVKEGIKTKTDYFIVLEALTDNLCEIMLKNHVPTPLHETAQFEAMKSSLYEAIFEDQLPKFLDKLDEGTAYHIVKKITKIQEAIVMLAQNPTKKNAKLVTEHYNQTCEILSK